ncbi:PilN domain-containing protein [Dokdonella sp.]|uniref:PilN domain-containing protein n=1 Tax=Dokdonella sp. TaxID=2291710 RepID=UPI002F414769
MANINLLPWRVERRKQREREFYMMLGVAAAGAVAVFLAAMLWMGHLIDDQDSRNAYLQQEIKNLDKKIEEIKDLDKRRSQLLTRKEIIEQLQSNRSQMVHLFDELVKTIPDGARLSMMKQAGDTLTLEGTAESNSRVATYMRNIDGSPWMGRSDLGKIENKSDSKDADKKMPFAFTLAVKVRKPEDRKDGSGEGEPAPSPAAPAKAGPATPATPAADTAAQAATKPAAEGDAKTPPAMAPAAETGEKK